MPLTYVNALFQGSQDDFVDGRIVFQVTQDNDNPNFGFAITENPAALDGSIFPVQWNGNDVGRAYHTSSAFQFALRGTHGKTAQFSQIQSQGGQLRTAASANNYVTASDAEGTWTLWRFDQSRPGVWDGSGIVTVTIWPV